MINEAKTRLKDDSKQFNSMHTFNTVRCIAYQQYVNDISDELSKVKYCSCQSKNLNRRKAIIATTVVVSFHRPVVSTVNNNG